MKRLLIAATALAALSTSAMAADLSVRTRTVAPAPAYVPAPIYNWTGLYIGGHIGGAFNGDNSFFGSNGRFIGGLQAGADYQFATNWVVGVEGQYSWSNRDTTAVGYAPYGFTVSDRSSNFGSVTGRLGYTWGPALLYAKGGWAFRDGGNVDVYSTAYGLPVSYTTGRKDSGWTVGGGLEYLFTPNWSGKIEYQYYNFGNTDVYVPLPPVGLATTVSYQNDIHTVKAGLNYRFNWGG